MLERNVNVLTALLLSAVGLLSGMLVAAFTLRHFLAHPDAGPGLKPAPFNATLPVRVNPVPGGNDAFSHRFHQVVPRPVPTPTGNVSFDEMLLEKTDHDRGKHKGRHKHHGPHEQDDGDREGGD